MYPPLPQCHTNCQTPHFKTQLLPTPNFHLPNLSASTVCGSRDWLRSLPPSTSHLPASFVSYSSFVAASATHAPPVGEWEAWIFTIRGFYAWLTRLSRLQLDLSLCIPLIFVSSPPSTFSLTSLTGTRMLSPLSSYSCRQAYLSEGSSSQELQQHSPVSGLYQPDGTTSSQQPRVERTCCLSGA